MYLIFPLFSGQGNTAPFSQSAGSLNKHHHLPHHNSSPGLRSIVHTPTDTLQLSPRPPPPQINNMVFVPTTAHSHVKDSNDTYTPSPSHSPIESPLSSTSSSLQDSLDGSISDTRALKLRMFFLRSNKHLVQLCSGGRRGKNSTSAQASWAKCTSEANCIQISNSGQQSLQYSSRSPCCSVVYCQPWIILFDPYSAYCC